ncbi:MAG: adenylate/guanylate cyclase domain-containing protein [Anaerolineales bacterium]
MTKLTPEQWWHGLLTGDNPALPVRHFRHFLKLLPTGPRCKFCNAPYHGIGAPIMRILGKGPSRLTPQLCRQCFDYASQYIGGAEVELTMLFADIRGSTPLAESMSPTAYSQLISRFFATASELLIQSDALVDRLVGDQVIGMYTPGFAGPGHRQLAIRAAKALLRATGHDSPEGRWIPVGVGVHTGIAFLGSVGSNGGATDVTVLGDAPNITARLSSAAGAGEILISQNAYVPNMNLHSLEQRQLELKGKSQPVNVYVLKDYSP